jgi:8-oxo-dGTP pyrophosphatase MutT (NUDIX family)
VTVRFDAPDPDAVPVLDAATVMLVRDGADGLEVFMLRRNLESDFVGGAYVFPGGAVDPHDGGPDVEGVVRGRTDRAASQLLGLPAGGLAFWVAAIRECFEEAGLLLAAGRDGKLVDLDDPLANERFVPLRRAVDSGALRLVELCAMESLELAADSMHYFSRWITPLGAPRRYDTRFFVAHAPELQTPLHDDREVIANLWIRPGDALALHDAGEFELIFPTVRSLEALDRFDTAEAVVSHAASLDRVDAVLPTVVEDGHGLRIVLPGDEVYDAETSRRVNGAG